MKKKESNINELTLPTTDQLEKELKRVKINSRYKTLLKSTVYVILIVVALAVLVATLVLPILQIYGNSMEPTLNEGNIVVAVKKTDFKSGDIIAFYYNNRILVKRVIATSSQWVDIDENGNVFVNNKLLEEPYLKEKYYGEVDIELPYQVPEGTYFVLGDERELSVDSRNSSIGTISQEDIIGKVIFNIWPFKQIGIIK